MSPSLDFIENKQALRNGLRSSLLHINTKGSPCLICVIVLAQTNI